MVRSRTSAKPFHSIALVLLVFLMAGVACTSAQDVTVEAPPTARPSTIASYDLTPTVPFIPTPSGDFTGHLGASVASLEERVYSADIIVRARLTSSTSSTLNFQALEYLKGTGDQQFTLTVPSGSRDTQWDDQEAILFLSQTGGSVGGGAVGQSGPSLGFLDTTTVDPSIAWTDDHSYSGNLPSGHSIDSSNPVWLPATSNAQGGGVSGQSESSQDGGVSGQSESSTFITEARSPAGQMSPSVDLNEVKRIIAWIEGGDGISGYDRCVNSGLQILRLYRDELAYTGEDWLETFDITLQSGSPAGTTLWSEEWDGLDNQYPRFRILGTSTALFHFGPNDPDKNPGNGYVLEMNTKRPLPAGTYSFTEHMQFPVDFPCNFESPTAFGSWTVTVTAPPGTLHEAFFDPQTIGSGDGYISSGDVSTGDLSPAAFSTGDTTTTGDATTEDTITITSLYGTGDSVTMTLSPYNNLAGHTLDFITGDGTTMLSLTGDAATGDSTAGTLTWAVSGDPWSSGDQLMLRITEPWFGVRVALSPRQGERQTYTDITISWADPQTCGSQYFVGLYQGDTPVRIWGYHPATPTGITRNTGLTWGSNPINTWTARVHCGDDDWRLVGDVPLTSGLP